MMQKAYGFLDHLNSTYRYGDYVGAHSLENIKCVCQLSVLMAHFISSVKVQVFTLQYLAQCSYVATVVNYHGNRLHDRLQGYMVGINHYLTIIQGEQRSQL